ncbi:MAG: phenylacetate--CoA ligase [Syntrophales bacterium]|nr:phenylacetate--CoA ligase [Syntrophales bacterium]
MKIWDPLHECMPREDLEQLQLERLQATLNRVYKNVVHYRKLFNEISFVPEDFQSLGDLKKLPFTSPTDLQENYPYGMFAVPLREVVRLHSAPGRSIKPIVLGYTKNDIRTWANLVARFMVAAGVERDDLVQIAFLYGLQTGAFGIHYGAEAIGASVIPMSTGNTEKQVTIMQDYRSTVLVCTPSYALRIADFMEEHNLNPHGLALRLGLFGGEPWTEERRKEIEERLGIVATDNYGVSEIIGPGIAGECVYKSGLHLFEDAFYPEIIDPHSGEVLPPGHVGELVITTLVKEAIPLIRYRTGDLTRLDYSPCSCGRTLVRMEKPRGRTDDMIIVKGVNVFPSQIEQIIFHLTGEQPLFQILVDHRSSLDQVEIKIGVTEKIFALELLEQTRLLESLRRRIRSVIGINTTIRLVEPATLTNVESKVKHIWSGPVD